MKDFKGIGLVDFVVLPHWSVKDYTQEYQEAFKTMYEADYPIITLNNNQMVYVENNKIELITVEN